MRYVMWKNSGSGVEGNDLALMFVLKRNVYEDFN